MPITFSAQDVKLSSFPHTDVMVVTVHIDIWVLPKSSLTMAVKPKSSSL
jgi:hypothetical protein